MKRRTLIQAGIALPFTPVLLGGCSRSDTPAPSTSLGQPGIYLADNFAPVAAESTLTELPVKGAIPPELTGRFLRNGPNPLGETDVDSYHWFTGSGMIHGVRLEEGRADWYRNRWVRSAELTEALGESVDGRALVGSPNTSIIGHGGRTWAIVESGAPPAELSYELETLGTTPGWGKYTAHPKLDPDTGELHALAYDWANMRDHIQYVVMDANAQEVKRMDIPMPGMTMIHDMSLTENYVVIFDLPVTISFVALGLGASFPFRWDDDHEPRVGLLPRNGGPEDIIWSPISSNYAYHPMNAYEDAEGNVVIDICRYDKMFDQDTNGPFGDSDPRLDRWTINPNTRRINEEIVDERAQEFPRIHPGLNSKPYRYGYTVAIGQQSFPGIYKHDMQTGETVSFDMGPGRHAAEPVFIPRQGGQEEDDGYLMTYLFDENRQASELIILDARDPSRAPLAQVMLPVRVPYGFHGNWVPDSQA